MAGRSVAASFEGKRSGVQDPAVGVPSWETHRGRIAAAGQTVPEA